MIKYEKLTKSDFYTSKKINCVTEQQHLIWTRMLDHYERHQLWFNLFNTIDRVRLWNTLVFSEGYFKRISISKKFDRRDLEDFYNLNIGDPIIKDEQIKLREMHEVANDPKNIDKIKIDPESKRLIRDKHYNAEIMVEMWRRIKQR